MTTGGAGYAVCNVCKQRPGEASVSFVAPMPRSPRSCHQLEHATAADPKALALYFETETEALSFARWLAGQP